MVADTGQVWSPLVQLQDPNDPTAPAAAVPTNYFRRVVEGVSVDQSRLRRSVYTHEAIQDAEQMMHALASLLISSWLEEGGEVVEPPAVLPRVSGLILPGDLT